MTPKRVIQLGFVCSTLGVVYLHSVLSATSTVWSLSPGLLLYGFGMGFGFSQLGNLTLSAVSVEQSGEASGVNNTLRQIGASFGSAVVGAALLATISSNIVSNVKASTAIPERAKPAIVQKLQDAGSNVEFGGSSHNSGSADVDTAITESVQKATVDGNKVALVFTGSFALLALIVSNILPNIRNLETSKDATSSGH
jgi:hypothetical protein